MCKLFLNWVENFTKELVFLRLFMMYRCHIRKKKKKTIHSLKVLVNII